MMRLHTCVTLHMAMTQENLQTIHSPYYYYAVTPPMSVKVRRFLVISARNKDQGRRQRLYF